MSELAKIRVKRSHLAAIIEHGNLDEVLSTPQGITGVPMWYHHPYARYDLLNLFEWGRTPQGHKFWSKQRALIEWGGPIT